MIEHVYTRVARARGLDRVVVLTDDERIARAVEGFGGEWEMTPEDCASGTDRIAWAARRWDASAVINVQGDEPLIDPEEISRIAEHLAAHPEDPVVTLATPATPEEMGNPNAVKVVLDAATARRSTSAGQPSRIPGTRGASLRSSTSGSTATSGRPCCGLPRCRPRRWSAASRWSSSAPWRMESASGCWSSTERRSASTRRRTWSGWNES